MGNRDNGCRVRKEGEKARRRMEGMEREGERQVYQARVKEQREEKKSMTHVHGQVVALFHITPPSLPVTTKARMAGSGK